MALFYILMKMEVLLILGKTQIFRLPNCQPVATNYITTNYPTATIQEANHKANRQL
jgi:hypothetical protein